MAERRMFAKSIIDSDSFLDMALSTQALYFHLSMRADDDGFINNPKKIMRMVGASQNEMELLLSKRFLLWFENGVMVIKHWRIHNYIRSDRYKPTPYQDELKSLKIKENGSYTDNADTVGIPSDIPVVDVGKVSLGEDSIDKTPLPPKRGDVPYKDIFDLYHNMLPELPAAPNMTDKRIRQIKQRWHEKVDVPSGDTFVKLPCNSIDFWERFFKRVQDSPHLLGRNDRGWKANLEWLTKRENFYKVIEGVYVKK